MYIHVDVNEIEAMVRTELNGSRMSLSVKAVYGMVKKIRSLEKSVNSLSSEVHTLEKKASAYKGHITRLKKGLKKHE